MKAPEQIAEDIARQIEANGTIEFMGTLDYTPNEFRAEIARRAIEADRAQRRIAFDTLDHMLSAWENYDGDVTGFYDAWLDHLNDGKDVPEWAGA